MTPAQFRTQRERLNLSQSAMARLLGIDSDNGARTIRRWEAGDTEIPGSVARLLKILTDPKLRDALVAQGYLPGA